MDGLKFIESLDSVWFFTNVFSSKSPPLDIYSDNEPNSIQTNRKHKNPKSESKPTTPILQIPQAQSPIPEIQQTQFPIDDIAVQSCPKCGDFAAEIGELREEEEEKRRTKRRLKSGLNQRRKNVLGLDFGFDVNEVYGFWMREEMRCGYGGFGGGDVGKMPAFSDGMAMREHLKSWAYAVACTVK